MSNIDKDVNVAEDKPRDEHSKLPWNWDDFSAYDADGNMVLYYTIYDDGVHTRLDGDKAFIVKAVNSYEKHTKALEDIANLVNAAVPGTIIPIDAFKGILEAAK